MKTKMSLEDKDKIIQLVLDNRAWYERYMKNNSVVFTEILSTCPLNNKHYLCGMLFPKWSRIVRPYKRHLEIDELCPCGHYSKGYVKRRMKKLFPELY